MLEAPVDASELIDALLGAGGTATSLEGEELEVFGNEAVLRDVVLLAAPVVCTAWVDGTANYSDNGFNRTDHNLTIDAGSFQCGSPPNWTEAAGNIHVGCFVGDGHYKSKDSINYGGSIAHVAIDLHYSTVEFGGILGIEPETFCGTVSSRFTHRAFGNAQSDDYKHDTACLQWEKPGGDGGPLQVVPCS